MTTNPEKENAGRGLYMQERRRFWCGEQVEGGGTQTRFLWDKKWKSVIHSFQGAHQVVCKILAHRTRAIRRFTEFKATIHFIYWRHIQNKNPPPSSKPPGDSMRSFFFFFFILFICFFHTTRDLLYPRFPQWWYYCLWYV